LITYEFLWHISISKNEHLATENLKSVLSIEINKFGGLNFNMRALYFKEINSFLSSIIGYVFIIIYLIASGLFHWVLSYNTNLLEGAEADMVPFFNLSPVIFLVLIPAITMRSIAEERRTGTIELLLTRPISDLGMILAKYFAGVTLLVIAIIPTIVYYISMYSLGKTVGNIDSGATLTSYIGLILLGAIFVAIGIFASSLTSSQIVAFILAMFMCWFFYDGFNLLGNYSQIGSLDTIIQNFGIAKHYDSIKKGVINSGDILYFFSVIVVFITASLTVVKTLKK
jgi:ABC-2 type transport system permease protein